MTRDNIVYLDTPPVDYPRRSRRIPNEHLGRIFDGVPEPVELGIYTRDELIFALYVGAFVGIMLTVAMAWVVAEFAL